MSRPFLKIARIVATTMLTHAAMAQTGITRTDLPRHGLGTTGREAIQVPVDVAPRAAFGKHTHPGEEIIYVMEGSLEYQVEGKPPVTIKAGEVFFVPAGTVHAARNVGSNHTAELAIHVVEKGKPPLTLVKWRSVPDGEPESSQSRRRGTP
ncbi:cupin domain-containing protein [Bradyrhizobium sp.]|uniref:cupin domain-containing protein n=1 Tax=Bradyrhizobium sp. TaxID=376 RepID=UPI003C3ED1FF